MDAVTLRLLALDCITAALGVGLILLGRSLWTRATRIAEQAVSWPTTEGTITDSRFLTQTTNQDGNLERQKFYYIAYSYAVDGKPIKRSTKVFKESLFAELQQKYPVHAKAEIRYDPARPKRSTLDLRMLDEGKSWAIMCFVFGAIMFFVMAIGIYHTVMG